MDKQYTSLMLISLAIVSQISNGIATKNSFQNTFREREKVTELQLYVQDILSGPNPTNVVVASANSTFGSPTRFGLTAVLDDPVRTAPSPDAEIVGRAQGFFAFASLEEISLHMTFDLVFTSGQHNGSVLNVLGHNPYPRNHRQLSIVGGSGAFQLARGLIGIRTVSFNSSTGDAFFQYNITILHY